MSAHRLPSDLFQGPWEMISDPGASGTFAVGQWGICNMVSATAEARTLPRTTKSGVRLFLYAKTVVGTITVTVTGNYNTFGDSTLAFTAAGQYAEFVSFYDGTNYNWRMVSSWTVANLTDVTATAAELNTLHSQTLTTGAGAGITGGASTVYKNSVQLSGGIYMTRILIDLTSLQSSTTDGDIIGQSTTVAHLGQLTAAQNGTILAGFIQCLEVPVTGVTDIDVFWAVEATGKFDDAMSGLTGTSLLSNGGAWTLMLTKAFADPVGIANGYLYLVNGAAGTVGTYSAGKFLITFVGY